jgi:hypothetical protein
MVIEEKKKQQDDTLSTTNYLHSSANNSIEAYLYRIQLKENLHFITCFYSVING